MPFTLLPPFYERPLHENPNTFLKRLEDEFSIQIERYAYLKDAFDHDVFIVNDEVVFRFPRTERDRAFLPSEISFLTFLRHQVEVNLPEYSYVSESGDFAGYKLIPRYVLSPGEFHKLSEKQRRLAIDQLVEFINELHRVDLIDFAKFGPRTQSAFVAAEERVERELQMKLFPQLAQDEVGLIKHFYQEAEQWFQEIPTVCATHGDLYAFNVIWDEHKSKVGVIDFSDLLIGDPAKDFEVFFDFGPEYAERAYKRYAGPKDDHFLDRSETYYLLHAIYTLLSSRLGALITFEHAHVRFRQKFKLQAMAT